ncbi:hypothetical protein ABIE69_002029 [Rhodobacteraceae bacterium MBR-64]
MRAFGLWYFFGAIAAMVLNGPAAVAQDAQTLAQQRAAYDADVAKPITALQPFRVETAMQAPDGTGLRLVSLNPRMNAWFLLEVTRPGHARPEQYHLENPDPDGARISLAQDVADLLVTAGNQPIRCNLFGAEGAQSLNAARETGLAFAPLCDSHLLLRNPVTGSRTSKERTVEFLRDNVWMGESIVESVKGTFFKDAFMESGALRDSTDQGAIVQGPGAADMAARPLMATSMGFDLVGTPPGGMAMGDWYAVQEAPGIFASALQPGRINPAILGRRGETNALDAVESRADAYLVAFDLSFFDLGYEMGTEHPRVDWSPRAQGSARNTRLPGPDGAGSTAPLVSTGMVSPAQTRRVAATFTAGFKRSHGAFKFGPLSQTEYAHHYGFIVQGVVLSKLRRDLSTIYVLDDGSVGMKTWTSADDALLPRIRFARQNGVPLIVPDPDSGAGVPGPFVRQWGPGNWSGSADTELRTLRAGACMKSAGGKQFLIYGYFSTATPSAMARTFQAYGCGYAMLLDMNALEHTYMALYTPGEGDLGIKASHLAKGMAVVDPVIARGVTTPRFIGFSDNRDFFYLLRKEPT